MNRPHAVIIGSGGSGAMVARLLARSGGWEVTVLEKGRNFFGGLGGPNSGVTNRFTNDELAYEVRTAPINQDPILEPRTFRSQPSDGDRLFVGNVQFLPTTVGGGTVHYDAKYRRFREVDFITNTLMGGTQDKPAVEGTTYTDWPVQYKHLEPFYAATEEVVGVQGPAHHRGGAVYNPNPYESWRSTPFPMPPGVAMLSSLLPAEAAQRLGYTPAAVPTSVNSRPYRGRAACNDCGFCLNYGCTINAKGSGVWPLNDALNTGRARLVTEANVVRVDFVKATTGRYRATGVEYIDPSGARHTLAADLVVMANTPIEATRLSLLSGISALPDSSSSQALQALKPTATEPSGLLGRNLMFHMQTAALAVMDQDIHSWRGRTSTHTLDAFAGAGPTAADFDPEVLRGGILEIGGNENPITEASVIEGILFGDAHKEWMRLGALSKRLTTFTMQGEDMPQVTNYVDLDPQVVDVFGQPAPRVTYKSHPYEIAASAFYAAKMLEIMDAIGGPGSPYPTRPLVTAAFSPAVAAALPPPLSSFALQVVGGTPIGPVPASAHIMGTHRMAYDRDHGPCDPHGRYWAFDNLYHAGGGLFCTAPGYNVSATMWALSYRVGAAIVAGVGGRDSYRPADVDADQAQLEAVIRRLDSDTMIARALGR